MEIYLQTICTGPSCDAYAETTLSFTTYSDLLAILLKPLKGAIGYYGHL
jgi:hypothetical protein